jgi:exodeoxyribonuclease VII large subunit
VRGDGGGRWRLTAAAALRPDGVTGSAFPGPFPVGSYAALLRDELRKRARVQLFGEVFNVSLGRARVYFELRDGVGACPARCGATRSTACGCPRAPSSTAPRSSWRAAPDYYPGSRTSSPSFSFDVTGLRVAATGTSGPGRRAPGRPGGEGLLEPQKLLPPPAAAALHRRRDGRGRQGAGRRARRSRAARVVGPGRVGVRSVQDRRAAPAITRALTDLAALAEVEVIVVARGGGSLADLFAFCDEALCGRWRCSGCR